MGFVNRARHQGEQTLLAFQFQGEDHRGDVVFIVYTYRWGASQWMLFLLFLDREDHRGDVVFIVSRNTTDGMTYFLFLEGELRTTEGKLYFLFLEGP